MWKGNGTLVFIGIIAGSSAWFLAVLVWVTLGLGKTALGSFLLGMFSLLFALVAGIRENNQDLNWADVRGYF